ncbi:scaffold protein [Stenotrophomonas phage BUCT598]|uniref:Scaffold protein n=1 Tax=Stenotrophomonas phage BUCT598 TaxID=2834253 RepID=A0A8F2F4F8_9CAUD|nr:scaffold protein [Stenotrophomonas phage BUCT598]
MTDNANPTPAPSAPAPAAPTPAPAPVAPAPTPTPDPAQVPTPAPEPTPSGDDKPGAPSEPYTADLGSTQLNYAVNHFVNGLGLRADSPEVQEFLRSGNDAYLKGHAAAKGIDASALEPFLLMANAGREEVVKAAEAKEAALLAEVEGYAGGKEAWASMAAFVSQHSTPEQKDEFDRMLDQGGIHAQAAVALIQSRMHADPRVSSVGKDAAPGAGAVVPAAVTQYSTRAEWRAAQRELISKYGQHKYESTPEGQALMAAYNPALR